MTAEDRTRFWRRDGDRLLLVVRLTPRADRDAIDGVATLADGRAVLKARVRAVPENGRANAALERLLARTLRLAARCVTVVTGGTSRLKTVAILEASDAIAARLAALEQATKEAA